MFIKNTQGNVCCLGLVKKGCFLKPEISPLAFSSFPRIQQKESHSWIPGRALWLQSLFLEGQNCVPDPIIYLATLILRFFKFKGGLIENDDLFAKY